MAEQATGDASPIRPEDTPRTRRRKADFLEWAQRRHAARVAACASGQPPPSMDDDAASAVVPKTDEQVREQILHIDRDGNPVADAPPKSDDSKAADSAGDDAAAPADKGNPTADAESGSAAAEEAPKEAVDDTAAPAPDTTADPAPTPATQ